MVFLGIQTAVAHQSDRHDLTAKVYAGERELTDFVKHAAAHLCEADSFGEALRLLNDFRNDGGHWKAGSTYIYILDGEGNAIFNGFDRSREQTSVLNDYGPEINAIVTRILETAKRPDGGFVEYDWDDPSDPHDDPPLE